MKWKKKKTENGNAHIFNNFFPLMTDKQNTQYMMLSI